MKKAKSFNAECQDRFDEVRLNRRTQSARTSATLEIPNTSLTQSSAVLRRR